MRKKLATALTITVATTAGSYWLYKKIKEKLS